MWEKEQLGSSLLSEKIPIDPMIETSIPIEEDEDKILKTAHVIIVPPLKLHNNTTPSTSNNNDNNNGMSSPLLINGNPNCNDNINDENNEKPLNISNINNNNHHTSNYKENNNQTTFPFQKKKNSTKHRKVPRLVSKNGECLIQPVNLPNAKEIILKNWFHLIIEYSWRSILTVFAGGFLISWVFFGSIYYLIVFLNGDLKEQNERKACIANIQSFYGAFLFSLESQHTIGYGFRYMTENCPIAHFVLCIQLVVGVFLQTMLAGIVVAKVLRPKKRKQEMRFSQFAVIGPVHDHDHRPALMIRLADIQHRLYLAESHVRLYMACTKTNKKGEKELIGVKDMNVGYDSGWDRVLLLWPIIVRHVIDEESPLYGMTQETMKEQDFELIMTVEGIVEATGMTFQARTSFLPDEINWGQRFQNLVVYNEEKSTYQVDYSRFECTEHADDVKIDPIPEIVEEDDEHPLLHNVSGFT
uniref:Inward rectifier potassium channel C-terminal domain-containing protein n=1 Tax=Strongyloides stercoralis TaxID=6248 RepID=A0A0K0ELG8_STRER